MKLKFGQAVARGFSYMLNILLICLLFVTVTYGGAYNGKYNMGLFEGKDYLVMLYSGDKVVNFWVLDDGRIERNPENNTTIWEIDGKTYSATGTIVVIELNDKELNYKAMKKKYNLDDSDIAKIQRVLGY
jgi:hypothetical protein